MVHEPFLCPSLMGGRRQLGRVGVPFVLGGPVPGGAGIGADTRCDRSRMKAWRSAIPGAVCCSWVGGRFTS